MYSAMLLNNIQVNSEYIMIVAHRGASKEAPENTIPAFQLAWEQDADAIEGDFHLTKDGYIVCIHDSDTYSVSGTNLVVRNTTLSQLRKLDVGVHFGSKFKGTIIPTIAEVFSTIPDRKVIYIEIKCGKEIIQPLLEEIKKSNLKTEQIVVMSFEMKVIQELKERAPQYKALWLFNQSEKKTPSIDTVLETLKQINADGLSATKNIIDDIFIKSVKEKGYEYHVWAIDDAETAMRFKKWGATSIITNVPGYMRKKLAGDETTADTAK